MASRFGLAEVLLAEWKATRKSRPSLRLLLSLGLSVCPSACPSVTVERTERATTLAQQEEDTTNAAATALTASAAPPVPSSLPPSLIPFPSSPLSLRSSSPAGPHLPMPFPRSPARPPVLAESLILIERVRARPRPARPLRPPVLRRSLSMIAVQCWSDVCWPRILRRRDNERAKEKDRIW